MTTTVATPNAFLHDHLQALSQHVQQCRRARGRWFNTALWAEQAHGLVAPRFMTTVLGAGALLALYGWWV
jgi:hypothetical protein